ncbi:MAG: hypothetical protein Q8P07_00750 [bacterium]|nr:hypothetical protein [bacterium]
MKNIKITAVLFVLLALSAGAVALASHSWGGYHWARTANPLTLKLGDNVSAAWDGYLTNSSDEWSAGSAVLNTLVVTGNTNSKKGRNTPKNCIPTAGRVEVCNAKYGSTGWLGVAGIWASGGHITQGYVKLNDFYFNTARYNTPAWRKLVMCQEIAHTFGLDHQDEDFYNTNLGTCMDYTSDPDGSGSNGPLSNVSPDAHDYEMLETIYAHLDSFTTLNSTASTIAPQVDTSNPREWGREIRTSKDGRASLFERDFGGGHKLFTFVFWAK